MKKYIWVYNPGEMFHAGSKAVNDVVSILAQNGYERFEADIHQSGFVGFLRALKISFRLLMLPSGSVFFVQFPAPKFGHFLNWIICRRFRTIALIHDINRLRGVGVKGLSAGMWPIKPASVVIAHNEIMAKWLLDDGFRQPILSLNMFDYLHASPERHDECAEEEQAKGYASVIFAGSLSPTKSGFLYGKKPLPVDVTLYGVNAKLDELAPNCIYKDKFQADAPPFSSASGWGLVWDGESVETCTGSSGQYQKYNAPHKVSLYLSCGMPVFIWREAASARIIESIGAGMAIDSLNDIERILGEMPNDKKLAIWSAARLAGRSLRAGQNILAAVRKAESLL